MTNVTPSEPPETDGARWFVPLADHLGSTYLRYSFTKGTRNEVDFLFDALELTAGARLLDAGCGPGRHLRAFTERGVDAFGVDIAETFCRLAADGSPSVPVMVGDIRSLPCVPNFDAVISLCQGGFGLLGGPGSPIDADEAALRALAACLRPGGRLALSAFSSYFQVRFQAESDSATFDADAGVVHERTVIRDDAGVEAEVEMWTTGFTPRELRLLARASGLDVEGVWSVDPGDYARRSPDIEHAEFLLVARKPR